MKVRTGAKKDQRAIEVELDDEDGVDIFGKDYETWTIAERYKKLTTEADVLVVFYLAKEGLISHDYAKQRVAELRA